MTPDLSPSTLNPGAPSQASSNFFSLAPVLKAVQEMTAVPFADQIVLGLPPVSSGCLSEEVVSKVRRR